MNTEWIKPGRALWHWWFYEDPPFERHKTWVDAAAVLGFEYYLVDENWGSWQEDGLNKWELLEEFVEYAKQRNVGVWVWKAYPDRNNVPGIFEKDARIAFLKQEQCSRYIRERRKDSVLKKMQ